MTSDLALVLGLLGLAIAMFVANRPRTDVVALMMLVALPLAGLLTVPEALSGLSDPSVVLIAALFVIGEGLVRTGIAQRIGDWLVARAGGSTTRLLVLLMVAVAALGSVMSSTGVVAIFIPIVLRVAARLRVAAAQLMMPMSVAALISGMLTLVGTPPNLVVNSELLRDGHAGFGFFSFTPFGIPVLLLAIAYMAVARRWLAAADPDEAEQRSDGPSLRDLVRQYGLDSRTHRLRLAPDSPLVGQRLGELRLRASQGITAMAIERRHRFATEVLNPTDTTILMAGDALLAELVAGPDELREICARLKLQPLPLAESELARQPHAVGVAEVIVAPASELSDKSVLEAGFRSRYGLTVVGLRRGRTVFAEGMLEQKLQIGDTLLLVGPWKDIRRSQRGRRNFLLLNEPAEFEAPPPASGRAPFALLSLGVAVALMVSGAMPHVLAALIGCLLMFAFRCIDMDSAYRAIHWPSIVLIVGMLPFSLALQKTGGIAMAAEGLIALMGDAGPRALLASLFAMTAVTGLFISNTATAVLMAPVALAMAQRLDLSPYPFAMIVALAASAAFMTPVSSPVNTLVLGPGRYRFGDFVRVGVPFTLLTMAVCVALVPWLLPFR